MYTTKYFYSSLAEQATLALLKGQVLGKVKLYGIKLEGAERLAFHELCDVLNAYEMKQNKKA